VRKSAMTPTSENFWKKMVAAADPTKAISECIHTMMGSRSRVKMAHGGSISTVTNVAMTPAYPKFLKK